MTTSSRTVRAPRALFPLAMAGALSALAVAPTSAFADATTTPTTTAAAATRVNATYAGAGVGYNNVIDGHSAGTVKLKVENADVVEAFCIEYAAAVAQSGTYTAKGYAESGVTNIAKAADIATRHNAVPGKLADPRAENTAAQLAIWKLTDAKDFRKVPNAAIVARAAALVAAAQAHTEAPSSFNVSATATATGEGDKAKDTVVAVVKTDAGTPVAGQQVRFTVGSQTLTGTTDAEGEATVKLDAPDAATDLTLSIDAVAAAGTVLVPAGKQAMVTTVDATVTREGTVVLPKAPKHVEETPTPLPAPTTTSAPEPTKHHQPPKPTTPAPHVLPHTGGWATTGMFLGAIAAAGAGFAGRRFTRRR